MKMKINEHYFGSSENEVWELVILLVRNKPVKWWMNGCDCIWIYVMCFNCGFITNKSGTMRSSRISNLCWEWSLNFKFDFSFYFPTLWRNFVKLYYVPSLFGKKKKKTPTTVFKIFLCLLLFLKVIISEQFCVN